MYSTGWVRDLPDQRDWDIARDDSLEPGLIALRAKPLPSSYDGREYCSPIQNQGRVGSCTAQAVVGMAEYLERREFGRHVDGSRMFLYKMARKLDGYTGDSGAQLRTAMKALRLFGTPPERYWPYDVDEFDAEPSAFAYVLAQNWQGQNYHRLDIEGRPRDEVLDLVRRLLVDNQPIVFGFLVFGYGNRKGEFILPKKGQRPHGGHAIMACGYDDTREIEGSKGALLVYNSWGRRWGEDGFGWIPYDYVLNMLTADFWTLIHKESFMR